MAEQHLALKTCSQTLAKVQAAYDELVQELEDCTSYQGSIVIGQKKQLADRNVRVLKEYNAVLQDRLAALKDEVSQCNSKRTRDMH